MRGPKPKSIEDQRRRGNPGKIAENQQDGRSAGGGTIPGRPSGLSADARNAWDDLVALLEENGTLALADAAALEAMATAWGRARQARRELNKRETTLVYMTPNGSLAKSPWLALEAENLDRLTKLGEQFG